MRIGMIGAGGIAEFHARAMRTLGHELVMTADVDEKKASGMAKQWGGQHTTRLERLLDASLDLVTVTVPNALHYEVCKQAIDAGHAVLCEKTLTRSASRSLDLVERAKRIGKPFFTGYMKRAHPVAGRFREHAGRLGTPRSGLVRVYHPFPSAEWSAIANRVHTPAPFLDGVLVHAGSHAMDMLMHVWGGVKQVRAARLQCAATCPQNDQAAHALFEMENGATVMLECGWLPLSGVGRMENGWDEMIQLRGDEGLATLYAPRWDRPDTDAMVVECWHESTRLKETFNPGPVDYFVKEYEWIERALNGEKTPLATVEDGWRVDDLLGRIYAAAGVERSGGA